MKIVESEGQHLLVVEGQIQGAVNKTQIKGTIREYEKKGYVLEK